MGSSTQELSIARQHGECWHLKLGLLFYRNPNSDKVLTGPQLLEITWGFGPAVLHHYTIPQRSKSTVELTIILGSVHGIYSIPTFMCVCGGGVLQYLRY